MPVRFGAVSRTDVFPLAGPCAAAMMSDQVSIGVVIAFGLVRLFYPHNHSETTDA